MSSPDPSSPDDGDELLAQINARARRKRARAVAFSLATLGPAVLVAFASILTIGIWLGVGLGIGIALVIGVVFDKVFPPPVDDD